MAGRRRISGGIGWAVLAPAGSDWPFPWRLGIGAAVLGTKVAIGSRHPASDDRSGSARTAAQPARGSPQARCWRGRRMAQRRIKALADNPGRRMARRPRSGRVDDEVSEVVERPTGRSGRSRHSGRQLAAVRPAAGAARRLRPPRRRGGGRDRPGLCGRSAQRALDALARPDGVGGPTASGCARPCSPACRPPSSGLRGSDRGWASWWRSGSDPVAHDRSAEVLGGTHQRTGHRPVRSGRGRGISSRGSVTRWPRLRPRAVTFGATGRAGARSRPGLG